MANARELRNRIISVRNTKKITSAMYLISSAKLRKAKEELQKTRPFFNSTETEIKRIFQSRDKIRSPYFEAVGDKKREGACACLVITADRGLAGAYNHNVIKRAEEEIRQHKKMRLFVLGEYGRRYFRKHKAPVEESFFYSAQDPTFSRARKIAAKLLAEYAGGRVNEIRIIYSYMENELSSVVKVSRVLPFSRRDFKVDRTRVEEEFEFDPSPERVLEQMVPSYLAGYIYGAMVDSFSAEQNARMNAMSNANRNAEELLGELQIEYNRVRQAAITQEITEVSAGARAQKKKRKRKASALQGG